MTKKALEKSIDELSLYLPEGIVTSKTNPEVEVDENEDNNDGSTRYKLGTNIFKKFDGKEYAGKVVSYDSDSKLYKIKYDHGDSEEFYHNEVKNHLKPTTKKRKKQLKKKKLQLQFEPMSKKREKQLRRSKRLWGTYIGMVKSKVTPTEADYDEHELTLTPDSLRAIAVLKDAVDMSEEAIPTNMLSIAINTLRSNKMTKEEAAMGHFTRHKLQKLNTWQDWLKGETEQLDGF